jgi:pyruvate kinase
MSIICTETEDNLYAICTKPYCDDCFGIMHRGRLQRKGFENYTYHRPYHHIMKEKKNRQKQREFEKDMRRKLSVRLSQQANAENISDSLRNFRRNMSKRLSTRISCISTDIFPNTLKENLFMIAPYITDDIEAIATVENYNDYFIKNIAASRINIPMFGFSNNQMLVNQMILNWNVQPIFSAALTDDFRENSKVIDVFFKKRGVRKYLLCGMSLGTDDSNPTFQVRNVNLFS